MTVKTRRAKIPAPKTYEECDDAILRLGATERALATLQAEMNARLALIKAEYEELCAPHKEIKKDLLKGIQTWCEKHREELLKAGAKTHRFPAGEVTWRQKPPRVAISGGADAVIAACLGFRFWRLFVRTKHEIDKEAMLARPVVAADVPGVTIVTGEEQFEIAPFDVPLGQGDPS